MPTLKLGNNSLLTLPTRITTPSIHIQKDGNHWYVPLFSGSKGSIILSGNYNYTLGGLKAIVSPLLASGEYFFGVNEGMASAAIYAPYMAVVPTQLLGFADGAMSQGFSTMYGLEALNPDLLIAGKIVDEVADGSVAVING